VSRRTPPSALACAAALAAAVAVLRLAGLRRAVRLALRLAGLPAAADAAGARYLVAESTRRVTRVAAFFPGRALCLEQSLALFALLRRRGVPVELRLGVQPFPFAAHAWIEFAGRPVNEQEDFVAKLAPFPSFGG
jgi:hypothetical protein